MSRRENANTKSKYQPSSAGASPENTGGRGRPSAAQPLKGLAIVATPIGHSRDITLRALDILGQADAIACEDTRVTAKLLAIHGISRPLVAYHEHNAEKARPKLIQRLKGGETVALVSDAGTPLVSDPGYKLVRACIEEGIPVTPVPGASSLLAALVVSGLPTDRFFFAGFLPSKSAARRRALVDVSEIPGSLVFMESARRLAPSLTDMARILGPRDAMIGREMTKMFEETRRGAIDVLAAHYQASGPPRGEVTIVVAPFKKQAVDDAGLGRLLKAALKNSTVRDAAAEVAAATGLARRKVYARALALQKGEKQADPK